MKKLIYLALAIVLLVSLASCGNDAPSPDGGNAPSGESPEGYAVRAVDDISEYKIVRSENASDGEKAIAVDLHKYMSGIFKDMEIATDYASAEKEILIGNTRRAESKRAAEGLNYYDYVIRQSGSKIVIVGGSDEALETAVKLFKIKLVDEAQARVLVPIGEGYKFAVEKVMDKLSIEGAPIEEFLLINNSLMSSDAALKSINVALDTEITAAEEQEEGKHYIILDGAELIADKYSVTIENGNITIRGSAHSLPAAIDFFTGEYLRALGAKTYDLSASDSAEGSTGKKEIYTRDQLMTVIEQVYADPNIVIVGEQLPGKTKPGVFEETVNKYAQATGQKPGIIGVDLACYGIDLMETDELSWSSYICDMVDYTSEGGIITISAHWENPSGNTGGQPRVRGTFGYVNTLEAYQQAFTDLITEGTEYNTFFKRELDTNVRFLQALADNGVPVIWRPLHEANGNFFWFCVRQQSHTLDASYIVNVWKYVYEYFTEEKGLTNLIWCYAPNYSTNENNVHGYHMSNTYLYPGDEYCDMVGVDWYSGGGLEITTNNNYLNLVKMANKPGALTEFGPGGDVLAADPKDQEALFNCMDLYGALYQLSKENYSFVYVLNWTGDSSVSTLGEGEAYLNQDMTLGQKEVKALFDALG